MPKTDFDSVDSYIAYVVEQVLTQVEEDDGKAQSKGQRTGGSSVLSKEEQKEVEDRLKGLGYL